MRVRTGARAVRTGNVFLVRKVIMKFSAGPSGRKMYPPDGGRLDAQFMELFLSFPMTPISFQSDI
jgi:hypothetical protein